jgi:hypothetical protein
VSLIVEDGTGKSNAESYASVAEASTYCTARGLSNWDLVNDQEAALRLATEFMVKCYRMRWAGYRTTLAQALDWPRSQVPLPDGPYGYRTQPEYVDYNVVPQQVKNCCIELAVRTYDNPQLLVDLDRLTETERVGEVSVTYVKGSNRQRVFTAAHTWIEPYLKGGSANTIPVSRA